MYSEWDKDALLARISELEAASAKAPSGSTHAPGRESGGAKTGKGGKGGKKQPTLRPFDFGKHSARPIALKVAYLGWKYHGLAAQETGSGIETVEGALFQALFTARLIPDASGKGCNWSRCGRTDKGVSSFGQVIACIVRSNLPKGARGTCEWPIPSIQSNAGTKRKAADDAADSEGDGQNEGRDDVEGNTRGGDPMDQDDTIEYTPVPEDFSEIVYVSRLNHILPPDIRVLAWSPVSPDFNARFDCTFRRYRYFFPAEGLDLKRMQEAAKLYVGAKDYRHFCKVDPSKNVKSYVRTVLDASVQPLLVPGASVPTTTNFDLSIVAASSTSTMTPPSPDSFLVFEVKGHAFLWHQVRCMTAILHLIGRGLEPVSLIDDLTDLSKHPQGAGRPIYGMASEIPLVLVECGFKEGALDWRVDGDASLFAPPTPIALPTSKTNKALLSGAFNSSDAFSQLIVTLWCQWREHAIKATQVLSLLQALSGDSFALQLDADFRTVFDAFGRDDVLGNVSGEAGRFGGKSSKAYIPIMQRKRCDSIEERTVKYNAAKKAKGDKSPASKE
ncbi:pseudouridine synthase [Chytriomyces sp. MP71]|nr:pseudouridine synthase [Chytriomyces sp. MP71]